MKTTNSRAGLAYGPRSHESFLRLRAVEDAVSGAGHLSVFRREWPLDPDKGSLADWWDLACGVLAEELADVERPAARSGEDAAALACDPRTVSAPREERLRAWTLSFSHRDDTERSGVWAGRGSAAVKALVGRHELCVHLYGLPEREAGELLRRFEQALAPYRSVRSLEAGQVPVTFWHQDRAIGACRRRGVIPCPAWHEIRCNYPSCADELDWLMELRRPCENGSIVFWHGPPGTGKTYAIRALMREWTTHSPEFITDPETFLADAGYMNEVILRAPESTLCPWDGDGVPDGEKGRLFVMEDAASLIQEASREHLGPLMSRLLNLTDGVLGQSLRPVVLLTSNEPLGAVDPAFTRPGRCIQAVEFQPFSREDAAAWLAARSCEAPLDGGELTLAELYRSHLGRRPPLRSRERVMGFAPRPPSCAAARSGQASRGSTEGGPPRLPSAPV